VIFSVFHPPFSGPPEKTPPHYKMTVSAQESTAKAETHPCRNVKLC